MPNSYLVPLGKQVNSKQPQVCLLRQKGSRERMRSTEPVPILGQVVADMAG